MLGSDLASACKESFCTVVFDLPDFDITNYKQLEQVIKDASIVLNCAAYTNVDGAESEGDLAYKVNAEAVGWLGDLEKKAGVWVLYISTNFVFDIISMDVNILPYKGSDYVTPAERPLSSRFDCGKIKLLLEGPIEPWQGPLDSFLRRL